MGPDDLAKRFREFLERLSFFQGRNASSKFANDSTLKKKAFRVLLEGQQDGVDRGGVPQCRLEPPRQPSASSGMGWFVFVSESVPFWTGCGQESVDNFSGTRFASFEPARESFKPATPAAPHSKKAAPNFLLFSDFVVQSLSASTGCRNPGFGRQGAELVAPAKCFHSESDIVSNLGSYNRVSSRAQK